MFGVELPTAPRREDLRQRIAVGVMGPALTALFYATATTIFVSGLWRADFLIVAIFAWILARKNLRRLPRILILRRFGIKHVEELVRTIAAGISAHLLPLWIIDVRTPDQLRHGLPGSWLYLMRPVVLIGCGCFIASRTYLNAPTIGLWLFWMIVATLSYHRFACGRPGPPWIGTVVGGATCIVVLLTTNAEGNSLRVYSWKHFLLLVLIFCVAKFLVSITLYTIAPRTRLARYFSARFVESRRDLEDFTREIRGGSTRHRFVPLVPAQVSEIASTDEFWGAAIYESIGASSVVIADVTGIDRQAAIGWEIEQTRLAGAPLILTCEQSSLPAALGTLRTLNLPTSPMFAWTLDTNALPPFRPFADELGALIYQTIEEHFKQDLSRLPERPTISQALARLKLWESNQARPMT